jgi:hypothetical protein
VQARDSVLRSEAARDSHESPSAIRDAGKARSGIMRRGTVAGALLVAAMATVVALLLRGTSALPQAPEAKPSATIPTNDLAPASRPDSVPQAAPAPVGDAVVVSVPAMPPAPVDRSGATAKTKTRTYRDALLRIRGRHASHDFSSLAADSSDPAALRTRRTLDALVEWEGLLGTDPLRWRGPILLGRATGEHALGMRSESLETFIAALLAMDAEGPQPPWGVPRLAFFASGPNLTTFSAQERTRWRNRDETRSGGSFIGGSPLYRGTEGGDFGRWLVGIARDDAHPEEALAATIWLHAVSAAPWAVEGYLPPAGVALVRRWCPDAEALEADWRRWYERLRWLLPEAAAQGDALALAQREELERLVAWRKANDPRLRRVLDATADWIWSLRYEVAARFPSMATPRGKALRALADRLITWE